jgi:hypothetical protein
MTAEFERFRQQCKCDEFVCQAVFESYDTLATSLASAQDFRNCPKYHHEMFNCWAGNRLVRVEQIVF